MQLFIFHGNNFVKKCFHESLGSAWTKMRIFCQVQGKVKILTTGIHWVFARIKILNWRRNWQKRPFSFGHYICSSVGAGLPCPLWAGKPSPYRKRLLILIPIMSNKSYIIFLGWLKQTRPHFFLAFHSFSVLSDLIISKNTIGQCQI